jgi:hypothetical protein
MSAEVTVGGGREFVEELFGRLEGNAEAAVFAATQFMRGKVVERLTGNRSGRTYFVPGAMRATYQASAPGESPASATGKLRQRVVADRFRRQGKDVTGRVRVDLRSVPYARRLEYGGVHVQGRTVSFPTPTGFITVKAGTLIRTAPRPYMRPAFDENREEGFRIMEAELNR